MRSLKLTKWTMWTMAWKSIHIKRPLNILYIIASSHGFPFDLYWAAAVLISISSVFPNIGTRIQLIYYSTERRMKRKTKSGVLIHPSLRFLLKYCRFKGSSMCIERLDISNDCPWNNLKRAQKVVFLHSILNFFFFPIVT